MARRRGLRQAELDLGLVRLEDRPVMVEGERMEVLGLGPEPAVELELEQLLVRTAGKRAEHKWGRTKLAMHASPWRLYICS